VTLDFRYTLREVNRAFDKTTTEIDTAKSPGIQVKEMS
jgi:hypothetical protein